MAIILDGKKLAEKINTDTLSFLSANNRYIGGYISLIQVGDDEATNIYIKNKSVLAEKLGLKVKHIQLPDTTNLIDTIKNENEDPKVVGILLQSPLPNKESLMKYTKYINPKLDIDCLNEINLGKLQNNNWETALLPATVKSVLINLNEIAKDLNTTLDEYTRGKNIVIINNSQILGKPLSSVLINLDATVTVCNKYTGELPIHLKNADIVISGVGKENLIEKGLLKQGVVCIDCGITKNIEGNVTGDFSKDVSDIASYLTPVPGGIGPLTVSCLFNNLKYLN